MQYEEVERRFQYHPPKPNRVALHEDVRKVFKNLAHLLNEVLPDGREKSLALTQLQDAMMWSNAAIACAPEGTL